MRKKKQSISLEKYNRIKNSKKSMSNISTFGELLNIKRFTKKGYELVGTLSLMNTLYESSDSSLDYDKTLDDIHNLKSVIEFLKDKDSDGIKIYTKYYNGPDEIHISIIDLNSKV